MPEKRTILSEALRGQMAGPSGSGKDGTGEQEFRPGKAHNLKVNLPLWECPLARSLHCPTGLALREETRVSLHLELDPLLQSNRTTDH